MTFAEESIAKSRLSLTSAAIVRHVAKCGAVGFDDLYEPFGEEATSKNACKRFRAKLASLVRDGHLQTSGQGEQRLWHLGVTHGGRDLKKLAEPAKPAGQVAQRRDLAPKGTWTAPRQVALRAGASDFAALPSLRNGQRVPFSPGYFPLNP